jgi:hypothetical protein
MIPMSDCPSAPGKVTPLVLTYATGQVGIVLPSAMAARGTLARIETLAKLHARIADDARVDPCFSVTGWFCAGSVRR